jgi:hypothetical protein
MKGGHLVRTLRTDCPGARRRTHSLSIESVRPAVRRPKTGEKQKPGRSRVTAQYDRQNLEAAQIIAADSVKYPADSGAHEWAQAVMKRLSRPPEVAGPLFGVEA